MTIELTPERAVLAGIVGVEDADTLREWCADHASAAVDLHECTHLHAANLQVLMAARVTITRFPQSPHLAEWMRRALSSPHSEN